MTHINFAIFNSHVTVIYLRYIKSANSFEVKSKILKQLYFSPLFILVYKMCFFKARKLLLKSNDLLENLTLQNLLIEIWPGQFFYYMKLGLSASMFSQIVGNQKRISQKQPHILKILIIPLVYFIRPSYSQAQKSI